MSASRRLQALFGPIRPGRSSRRLLSLPVRLVVLVSTMLIGLVGTAAVASAHHAEVTATSNCQNGTPRVSYTATAWNGTNLSDAQRTNHQVEVAYSTSGQNGPWTVVVSHGQFVSPDFAFNGTFTPTPDTAGMTVTVRAVALVNWGDGASPGAAHYADAILKDGCTPVPLKVALPCPSSFSYGTATTFTANAAGGVKPYKYQWTLGTKTLASTSSSAVVTLGSSNDVLTVRVTDHNGATATAHATDCAHGSYPNPTVTLECPAGGFVFGQPATWTVLGKPGVDKDNLGFQWFRNGTAIPGAHQASYTATLTSANDILSVTATETFADAHMTTSQPATAGEDCRGSYPKPTVTIACPATGFVYGEAATWTAEATAAVTGDNLSYRWLLNGKVVGTDSRTLTTTLDSASATLSVSARESFADEHSTASAPTTAQCHPKPVVAITCPAGFAYGQPATWTAVATPGSDHDTLSYQWSLNGKPIVGATKTTVTATLASSNDVLSVTVTESDETHAVSSVSKSAACQGTYPKPVVVIHCPASFTFGQPATWTAAATPGAAGDKLSYRWTVNGTVVGANSPSLTTTLNSATDKLLVTVTETFADAKTSSASAVSGCTDAPAVAVVDTDVDSTPSAPSVAPASSPSTGTLPFTGSAALPLFALAMGLIGAGVIVLGLSGNLKGRRNR